RVPRQPTSTEPATREGERRTKTYGRSASVPMTRSIQVAFGGRVDMLPSGVVTVLTDAIARAQEYLLAHQAPEGHWVGELEADTTITSEYLLLGHLIARVDLHKEAKAVK